MYRRSGQGYRGSRTNTQQNLRDHYETGELREHLPIKGENDSTSFSNLTIYHPVDKCFNIKVSYYASLSLRNFQLGGKQSQSSESFISLF